MIEVLKQMVYALEESKTDNDTMEFWDRKTKAIKAGKQAIAELESQEPYGWVSQHTTKGIYEWQFNKRSTGVYKDTAISILPVYTHPPQRTEQEPVAWMDADGNVSDNNDHKCFPIPLYTHPPQEQRSCDKRTEQEGKQMIDWYSVEGETRRYGVGMVECAYAIGRDEVVHVVTHESVKDIAMQHLPPQRTWERPWVSLTDEEAQWLYDNCRTPSYLIDMVEAKLREKNT